MNEEEFFEEECLEGNAPTKDYFRFYLRHEFLERVKRAMDNDYPGTFSTAKLRLYVLNIIRDHVRKYEDRLKFEEFNKEI